MILTFDGSFQGFMSLIHAHYYQKLDPVLIQTENTAQLTLDSTPRHILTDLTHAATVEKAILHKVSPEALLRVKYALLSDKPDKFMSIFKYVQLAFQVGHMVDSHLQTPCVQQTHDLARHVGREAHLLNGFCRFQEVVPHSPDNQVSTNTHTILYAVITPKNNVLALVADHFTQRLKNHIWVIHDKSRHQAAIYNGDSYTLVHVPIHTQFALAPEEAEIQTMWKAFFKSLTIEARRNPKVQRQLLPLYFRKNMVEFQPD